MAREERRASEDAETVLSRPVLRPASDADPITIERTGAGWRVDSERVRRWVVMTDLGNDEAVKYLQGRLLRAGVEASLLEAGAQRGDEVEMAGFVFDFEPDLDDEPDEDVDELGGGEDFEDSWDGQEL
jgi:GTPase